MHGHHSVNDGPDLLKNVVTGNASWIYDYAIEATECDEFLPRGCTVLIK